MVYKKYIKKGGKTYGPYYYHSRREGGKVISEYHGPPKKPSNKKFLWILLGVVIVAGLIYGIGFANKSITGHAILSLDADYQEGQALDGVLNLALMEGELIPASSKIVFESSDQIYEHELQSLVSDTSIEGDFYVAGQSFSGTGMGYGIEGISESAPIVYFTLELSSLSGSEEPTPETPAEENVSEDTTAGSGITGMASLGFGTQIDGEVSVDNDFTIDLQEGQSVEIVSGSVKTDREKLSDDMITLTIEGTTATVTTDYSEIRRGFGEDYLGDQEKQIPIDISGLDMIFAQGDLKVSLIYKEQELISLTTTLQSGESAIAETPIVEEPTPEPASEPTSSIEETTNETQANVTVEFVQPVLTDVEKAVLEREFGDISIEVTKAEEKNNRLFVRYEFADYWIEATYEVNLSEAELKAQMEFDKTKWLKDIAKSLSEEEPPVEEVEELLGNYSI